MYVRACVFVDVVVLLLVSLETLIWYVYSVVLCVFPSLRRNLNGKRKSKSLPNDSQEISSRSLYRCKFIFSVSVSTKSIPSLSLCLIRCQRQELFSSRDPGHVLCLFVLFFSRLTNIPKQQSSSRLSFILHFPAVRVHQYSVSERLHWTIHTIVQKENNNELDYRYLQSNQTHLLPSSFVSLCSSRFFLLSLCACVVNRVNPNKHKTHTTNKERIKIRELLVTWPGTSVIVRQHSIPRKGVQNRKSRRDLSRSINDMLLLIVLSTLTIGQLICHALGR